MLIFKLCTEDMWRQAVAAGSFAGSADDTRDGYIHLSTASQLSGTAAKYFRYQQGLVVVAFEGEALGPGLRWEPSRGGDLFPHFYGQLDPTLAAWIRPAPLDGSGLPILPLEDAQC